MNNWDTRYYEVAECEDGLWEAAFHSLPRHLTSQIEPDFGVCWVAQLSEVEAVRMTLAIGTTRIKSEGDGVLIVSDCVRVEFLERLSESAGVHCQWWRLRRVHFATARSRQAFEAALRTSRNRFMAAQLPKVRSRLGRR